MFEKFEENIIWPLERIWNNIYRTPRRIKWLYQRATRGYADCDLWSFDWYLDRIFAKAIKQFAKNVHSYPACLEAKTPKAWDKILNEMADGFQARVDYEERLWEKDDPDYKLYKESQKKHAKSLKLFTKWYQALWD